MKTTTLIFSVTMLVVLIAASVFYFRDTDGPLLSLRPGSGPVSANRPLVLSLEDAGSGLKTVQVNLVQNGKAVPVLARTYGPGLSTQSETLQLPGANMQDGPIEIAVVASDRSVFPFGKGNTTEQSFTFTFDRKAPMVSVMSNAHNINQGGSALIVYNLNEEVDKTGVMVGDYFFPGLQQPSGVYASLFAFPYNMDAKDFTPQLIAVDKAGNERKVSFYHHANKKKFRRRTINVSKGFLAQKAPEFEQLAPQANSHLDAFLVVNRDLRQKNRAKLKEFAQQTSASFLWSDGFLRQPKAATLAQFADHRTYLNSGKTIDKQTHLGIDLASVAQAPVPSANDGIVVFADYLGIYGKCVIVDHGLGLQSLYGHLSRITVQAGEQVRRGQVVGNTGATGMAGGDHLHYGMILWGLPVSPLEWWDDTWIKNNIKSKLAQSPQAY